MSTKDPRQAEREFAANKFRWLEQVANDGELPPLASRLAIILCPLFNREYGGRAWASQEYLAGVMGVRRQRINQVLQALVKRGHLRSVRRGKMEQNYYYFVDSDVRKTGHHSNSDVRKTGHLMSAKPDTIPSTDTGAPNGAPGRERAARAPGRARARPGLEGKRVEACQAVEEEVITPAAALRADIYALWHERPWERSTREEALDLSACEVALRDATADTILAAAEARLRAADSPDYLPKVHNWLKDRPWSKPPPKKRANGKVTAADVIDATVRERYSGMRNSQ
jgi:hypothetical protein